MTDLICALQAGVLDDASLIEPLLELLEALPNFSPQRYDLNQHDSWRPYDRISALIDALNQRVSLLRVRGQGAEALAMLSLGRASASPPMLLARFSATPPLKTLLAAVSAHVVSLPMRALSVTCERWRRALPSGALGELAPAPLLAFPLELEPAALARYASEPMPHAQFTRRLIGQRVALWTLSNTFEPPVDPDHLDALGELFTST